jgi:nucleoside-diphosphate kinase
VGAKTLQNYRDRGVKTKETAEEVGRRIRGYLIKFLTSGPVVAMVIEGESAIFIARKLVGSTESRKSDPSTIRGSYSPDSYEVSDSKNRPVFNLVHAADDAETAKREIGVWFKEGEILSYKRAGEELIS